MLKTAIARVMSWFAPKPAPVVEVPAKDMNVNLNALNAIRAWGAAKSEALVDFRTAFAPANDLDGNPLIAMDTGLFDQVAGMYGSCAFQEGVGFMGYAILAQLTQRTEYRMISEIRAEEMTRKWIEIQYTADEDDKGRVAELAKAMDSFKIRDIFHDAIMIDGEFGRSQIYIDTGATDNPKELALPLVIDKRKVGKGGLKGFTVVEPIWSYPLGYDAQDPLKANFYRPQEWTVNGKTVHRSRMLTIVSKPVPDILKPAYAFGGMSLTQMVKPYVDNWIRTRQSVADLIHSFSMMILQTDMNTILSGGSAENLLARLEVYSMLRDNKGMFAVNKETEDMKNIAVPLSGLDKLQAQSQEQMASPARTPLVKLFGITPSGLNASSDGEIRVYYDSIHAAQEKIGRAPITAMMQMVQLHLWGEIDENITFSFVPLWQMTEEEAAGVRKSDMETDVMGVQSGILDPVESRKRLAADKHSVYAGLDVEDVPEGEEDAAEEDEDAVAADMAHDAA